MLVGWHLLQRRLCIALRPFRHRFSDIYHICRCKYIKGRAWTAGAGTNPSLLPVTESTVSGNRTCCPPRPAAPSPRCKRSPPGAAQSRGTGTMLCPGPVLCIGSLVHSFSAVFHRSKVRRTGPGTAVEPGRPGQGWQEAGGSRGGWGERECSAWVCTGPCAGSCGHQGAGDRQRAHSRVSALRCALALGGLPVRVLPGVCTSARAALGVCAHGGHGCARRDAPGVRRLGVPGKGRCLSPSAAGAAPPFLGERRGSPYTGAGPSGTSSGRPHGGDVEPDLGPAPRTLPRSSGLSRAPKAPPRRGGGGQSRGQGRRGTLLPPGMGAGGWCSSLVLLSSSC